MYVCDHVTIALCSTIKHSAACAHLFYVIIVMCSYLVQMKYPSSKVSQLLSHPSLTCDHEHLPYVEWKIYIYIYITYYKILMALNLKGSNT